jgi:predicted transcriptional regulator
MEHKYITEFKKLEAKLKKIAKLKDTSKFNDLLDRAATLHPFINEDKHLIQDLYGLRNVFVHSDRDKYIAEVNDLAFISLARILELLENPPKAISFTKNILKQKEVYWVQNNQELNVVVNEMAEKIYTHIPVYDGDLCVGVFTETSLLLWLKNNVDSDGIAQFKKRFMSDVDINYMNPDTSTNRSIFIKSDSSIFDVWQKFNLAIKKGDRLGAIILTKDGKRTSEPEGIITSWDLPRIQELIKD